jgi:hypothetical protein
MVDDAPIPEPWRVNKVALAQDESDDSDENDENDENDESVLTSPDCRWWRRLGDTDHWGPWDTGRELWARLAAASITLPSRIDHLETLLCLDPDDPGRNPLITHLTEWIPSLQETLRILSTLVVFGCKRPGKMRICGPF